MSYDHIEDAVLSAAIMFGDQHGDTAAAMEYGITTNIIKKARKSSDNKTLAALRAIAQEEEVIRRQIAGRSWRTLGSILDYLDRVADEASTKDPLMVEAVVNAAKTVNEIIANREVLDVWIKNAASSPEDAIEPQFSIIDEGEE